jgi:2-polyprenyl-3-methyl-5-hydroxy-6-metoxy-1,4-benzoquinol methylase
MSKQVRYSFHYIQQCNLCDAPSTSHKILGRRLNTSQGKNPRNKVGIATTIMKCKNCGLIFSNPQPIPYDIQDHYGVPPENYWKPDYFKWDESYFKYEIGKLKELMPFQQGQKALDIGAGLGKGMLSLMKAGYDTYGFEPSKPFYERAISQMGIPKERLKIGMIEEMNYPENEFDFISFGAVMEHLYDPSGSILQSMKWLKPGGLMQIEVPSSDWLINKIFNFVYKIQGLDYVANISPMHEPFHLYEFGINSFRAHAKKHGYELAFHEYYVCQTFMPKFTDFILKPYMKATNKGMQLTVWLQKK